MHARCGIDFKARAGEFFVMFGPSGSGKSIFLIIIGGLVTPTEGTARFGRHDLSGTK